ncbi:hypothetical protein [Runella sp.]|uniref:hypothetical protein n=1 Tax=Runella sp. TaxID=1960881 RepID=UPI003D0C69A5
MLLSTLHSLIHSLSKSEKRFFTLLVTSEQKDFYRLYELLESQPVVNEKQLNDAFGEKSLEPARKYLYRTLMKALRLYESEKNIEGQLMNLLQDARILHDKGFFNAAHEQLDKLKVLALQHEKFSYWLPAIRLELQLHSRSQFGDLNEQALVEQQNTMLQVLEHEQNFVRHAYLFETLSCRYWQRGLTQNPAEVQRLNDLLLEEYQLLNSRHYESFEAQKLHLHFQSQYFLMTGAPESSLSVFYELIAFYDQHSALWKDAPIHYLYVLDGILADLRWCEQFDQMPFFIQKLRDFTLQNNTLIELGNALTDSYQMQQYLGEHRFDEAFTLAEKAANTYLTNTMNSLPTALKIEINLLIARIYFHKKLYQSALKLLNNRLNEGIVDAPDYWQWLYYMLRLMIQYELGNFDYLEYELKNLGRRHKKTNAPVLFSEWLSLFLKLLTNHRLLHEPANKALNPQNLRLRQWLPFEEWVKEKAATP